jgi:hypothetical protein
MRDAYSHEQRGWLNLGEFRRRTRPMGTDWRSSTRRRCLPLLLYGCCQGKRSSQVIEQRCVRDVLHRGTWSTTYMLPEFATDPDGFVDAAHQLCYPLWPTFGHIQGLHDPVGGMFKDPTDCAVGRKRVDLGRARRTDDRIRNGGRRPVCKRNVP